MEVSFFVELSAVLAVALILGLFLRILRQPIIIGYILTGVIASPFIQYFFTHTETFEAFGKLGVAFLLFIVGLQLNPRLLKDLGKNIMLMGTVQIVLTAVLGFGVGRIIGFEPLTSLYIGIALSFSSTIIISKLLSDRGDISVLYGRLAIGILLVQDVMAIIILILLSTIDTGSLSSSGWDMPIWVTITRIIFIIIFITFFVKVLMPAITKTVSRSHEMLFLFSVFWAVGLSALFYALGFSMEAGALIAGVALSYSNYQFEIAGRLRPIRDFFIIMFFVILGFGMRLDFVKEVWWQALVLSLFVIVAKTVIIAGISGFFGYRTRTIFGLSVSLAQVSEFSFILIGLGLARGHLTQEIVTIITIVGLISIAASVYMVEHQPTLVLFLDRFLKFFERKIPRESAFQRHKLSELILFGYNRIGFNVLQACKAEGISYFVIDYDPEVVKNLEESGETARFGDAASFEMLKEINFKAAKMVISTIPNPAVNIELLRAVKKEKKGIIFMSVAHQIEEADELYAEGADFVILPHFLGGEFVANMLKKNQFNRRAYRDYGEQQKKVLKMRKMLGHEHPSFVNWFR